MTAIPLKERYEPVTTVPAPFERLLRRTNKRSSVHALLQLLIQSPPRAVIGTCAAGADEIQLGRSVIWFEDSVRKIFWRELVSALSGVRYLLKSAELPYAVWCSCPDWRGGRRKGNYKKGPTEVAVGLVDKTKKITIASRLRL